MTNRRERRAQAKEKKNDPITFSHPSRDPPTHKTLIDLASERASSLNSSPPSSSNPSITTTRINPDGTLSNPNDDHDDPSLPNPKAKNEEEEDSSPPESPYLDIALYTLTLTILHFTLTVLVHHQYTPHPPSLPSLFYTSTILSGSPLLILLLVSTLHPRASSLPVQCLFAITNIVAGMWLVRASNVEGYLAVMKKAPGLGVIWVWAVVELRWEVAVGGLGVVGGWAWWWGYGFW